MRPILAALFLLWSSALPSDEKVNVVILLADDLGWGDLSCTGNAKFRTPNLDRMAEEGARLTDFTVPVPFCAPTRASLLTGRYPPRHGLTQNPVPAADLGGARGGDALGLAEGEVTLGEAFQSAGYRTLHIGKWHLGHQPRFFPTRNGFHEYFGILYSNDMHPVELFEGEKRVEYPVVQATLTRRYTERALRFLEENRERPFFLYFAHAMPHKPVAASEEFYRKSGAGLYGDAVTELDAGAGQVLAKLKALGLEGRTLVFFASDNGPWYGGSAGGLRGMKGTTWEGGLRVPLIARWPGKIPAGRVIREPAIILDLFTTSLSAAGIAPPADRTIDGKDLLPMLAGDAKSPHEALLGFRGGELRTVRSGKWKLHLAPPGPARERAWKPDEKWVDPRGPDGVRILAPYEQAHPSQHPGVQTGDPVAGAALFDLEADPAEQKDQAAAHPAVVERLKALAERQKADLSRK